MSDSRWRWGWGILAVASGLAMASITTIIFVHFAVFIGIAMLVLILPWVRSRIEIRDLALILSGFLLNAMQLGLVWLYGSIPAGSRPMTGETFSLMSTFLAVLGMPVWFGLTAAYLRKKALYAVPTWAVQYFMALYISLLSTGFLTDRWL
jgi:hypothetical protein